MMKQVTEVLNRFIQMSKEILGENLKGIYLHGSAAMGCLNPKKSDLDLLLVVEHDIGKGDKFQFMEAVVRLNEEAPAKGIELSVVKQENCNPFVYPTPFELHFSRTHMPWFQEDPDTYVERMHGTDKDLAAHVMIIHHYGKVLYGTAIADMFGPVSEEDYMDSIWEDIRDAEEHILKDPVYVVLNLLRVLAYAREKLVLSKRLGGQWGLGAVPERYHGLIREAMMGYESGEETEVDRQLALEFEKYMVSAIVQNREILYNRIKEEEPEQKTGGCHDFL